VIDVGTWLILPGHVCGTSIRITPSKVPKVLSLNLPTRPLLQQRIYLYLNTYIGVASTFTNG
jgi:hypothetical protein